MLRPARPEEAGAVATVLIESRRAFLPFPPAAHPEHDVRRWVRDVLIPGGRVVVWTDPRDIVGVLATSEDEEFSWIDQLYLLPGFVGLGIGSSLLRHAHAVLREPIRLYTFQQNAGARRFYERHGYRAIEFSDGHGNEEQCPDVLYELSAPRTDARQVDRSAVAGDHEGDALHSAEGTHRQLNPRPWEALHEDRDDS